MVSNLRRYLPVRYHNQNLANSLAISDSEALGQKTDHRQIVANNSSSLTAEDDSTVTSAKIEQWSPSMQSLLEEPPSNLPLRLILSGIVFLFLFTAWAWLGEVEKIGKAQGKLIPKGEAYKIESLDSAKISQIAVAEGEEIAAGQLIAELNPERQLGEVTRLEEMLAAHKLELSQKHQLLSQTEIERNTHQAIAQAEIESQQAAIASAQEQAAITHRLLAQQRKEIAAYTTRQKEVKNLAALEREKLAQIKSELVEHQARISRLEPLLEQGAVSQEFVFQATQAQSQAQQQLIDNKLQSISDISAQIFQSEQSLREMGASITQSQGELLTTQREIERLQAELAHKKAERQKSQLDTEQKIQQLKLDINQTNTKIIEVRNQLADAKTQLNKRYLRSPVAGTVLALNVTNTGKVVQTGETVAEIAPHGSPLVLLAMLPDRDAGFIEPGMPVQVKFDAYAYQDYGVTPGRVVSISSDTKDDEQLGAVYEVKIALERNYINDEQRKISFKPGQTATANIIIRRRRIIDVLLDPIKKLEQDGIDL